MCVWGEGIDVLMYLLSLRETFDICTFLLPCPPPLSCCFCKVLRAFKDTCLKKQKKTWFSLLQKMCMVSAALSCCTVYIMSSYSVLTSMVSFLAVVKTMRHHWWGFWSNTHLTWNSTGRSPLAQHSALSCLGRKASIYQVWVFTITWFQGWGTVVKGVTLSRQWMSCMAVQSNYSQGDEGLMWLSWA